jgi:membrane-anchored mycosin MYCP
MAHGHWWRYRRVAGVPVLALPAAIMLAGGLPAAAAPGTVPPPIEQPGGLEPGRCLPPSGTVVTDVPWAQQMLQPERVWPLTRGGGVVVAVIDTGVDAAAPQLAGRVLAGADVLRGGRGDSDCAGHGTFVAGIIAAAPATGAGFHGLAPDARILPVRQSTDGLDGTALGLAAGIRWAVDAGAAVINVSAAAFYPSAALKAAVDYAAGKDVLVVAAASNEARNGDPRAYPAAYPSVVAVAAVDYRGVRADFSATGDHLSVAAPGQDVVSIGPGGAGDYLGSGTSYATAFVTAVAALVRAGHPGLAATQVRRRIQLTADRPAGAAPDGPLGWGVVNPYRAVTAVLPDETAATPVPAAAAAVHRLPPAAPPLADRRLPAVLVALAAALAVAGLGTARVVLRHGRRRGWRPATAPASSAPGRTRIAAVPLAKIRIGTKPEVER